MKLGDIDVQVLTNALLVEATQCMQGANPDKPASFTIDVTTAQILTLLAASLNAAAPETSS